MKCRAFLAGVFALALAIPSHAADPITVREIAMLLRNGERPRAVLAEVMRRKLASPVAPDQEAYLRMAGASPELLKAFRSPTLAASQTELAAWHARAEAATNPAPTEEAALPKRPVTSSSAAAVAPNAPLQTLTEAEVVQPNGLPVPPGKVTAGVVAAQTPRRVLLRPETAFDLSQLQDAKARAVEDHKPLGFIVAMSQSFNMPVNTHDVGSVAALAHFFTAFNDSLVLVFVRDHWNFGDVPAAVARGFRSPGGEIAPNMAVVDATGSELIAEVPYGGNGSNGAHRDKIFSLAAKVIERWLASHPQATAAEAAH